MRPLLSAVVARAERRHNPVLAPPPYEASEPARALHATLDAADLHADSLLWGRDLLVRSDDAHVDVPRLLEARVALQVLAASTKVPRRLNIERNDDRTDDVTLLALAQRWPRATWTSLMARALYLAERARRFAERSGGTLRVVETRDDLAELLADRAAGHPVVGGLLAVEGAHALEDDVANVDVLAEAGFRMLSPSHFFDTAFGGSAHGVEKGGLTSLGRAMVERMEARRMLVDVAHASSATITDVLAVATRPVVVSHTGVRGMADNARNLSDDHLRGIAATGGVVGIGFWETACGGRDAAAIARSIRYAADLIGDRHVALGSDFDGAVPTPFDVTGLPLITDALLAAGWDDEAIRRVMGGNVLRLLGETLPER